MKIVGNIVFFFKQKTAYEIYQCDWSSDVCSSDLAVRSPTWWGLRLACSLSRVSETSAAPRRHLAVAQDRKSVV